MALPVHSLTEAMVGMAPANTVRGGVDLLTHSIWEGGRGMDKKSMTCIYVL